MSSEDQVADIHNRNYIDNLPTEVLCMVFDQFDFEDLKNASAVCQQWNNIAERFIFKIDMHCKHGSTEESIKQKLPEVREVIGKTKRCYRVLKWDAEFFGDEQEILLMWNAIHPKITANLYSLQLDGVNGSAIGYVVPLLAKELPTMTQLRSLILELSGSSRIGYLDTRTILHSNTVTHLRAKTSFKIRVEMPKLQSFEGSLPFLYRPNENLKNLIVDSHFFDDELDKISKKAARSILQQCKNLETINWVEEIEDEIFAVLCDICTSIRELTIRYIGTGPKRYRRKSCFDLTKLTKLSKLELKISFADTFKLPKSLKKLKICLNVCNHQMIIDNIIESSKSLEELQVVFDKEYEETDILLKNLSVLQHLQVLVFYGGRFEESSFLHMTAPLERVRQLRFVECKLSTKHFLGIREKFPSLKEPQFI